MMRWRGRRRAAALVAIVAIAVAACTLFACGRRAAAPGPKMIVLGFDGLDYTLTKRMLDEGRLPNFARLAKGGSFTPLGTSIPPQSPVAWASFITGLDPGGHGIFDFIHRDAKTLVPYLSTTKTETTGRTIGVAGYKIPLSGGSVTLLREGQAFWEPLESRGVKTTIVRMPANFPPSGTAGEELSGMGTPDLLGTYGTFSLYTSEPFAFAGRTVAGGKIHQVRVFDSMVRDTLRGPDNPYLATPQPVTVPFTAYIDRGAASDNGGSGSANRDAAGAGSNRGSGSGSAAAVKLMVGESGEQVRVLKVGEWTDWVPLEFKLIASMKLRGMCRFYLKQVEPYFELYVTPLNLDPLAPALPISTPGSFAADLARATGRFYTQGMPEDTKAFSAGVFNADEFLAQAKLARDEVRRQYDAVLPRFLGEAGSGLLFYYVGNVDQVSHMMWRATDPEHPAYNAETDARYKTVIEDLYIELDRMVGDTLDRIAAAHAASGTTGAASSNSGSGSSTAAPAPTVVVMSDHGFTSWRRTFHLNRWLEENGYLAVRSQTDRAAPLFGNIDWTRTRAYGLGLNGLYLNVRGREAQGIVEPGARAALADEIAAKLLQAIDPKTGQPAIAKMFRSDQAFHQVLRPAIAPDLIVGYAKGTRGSNESAIGEVPAVLFADNMDQWSGDHCMDPAAVPGVLFTSRRLSRSAATLQDLAAALLAEYGVTGFPSPAAH
jgi:predicted AlkP superfamily phosphohydrolase/phosphomutase